LTVGRGASSPPPTFAIAVRTVAGGRPRRKSITVDGA
jgi:hypothetical protein